MLKRVEPLRNKLHELETQAEENRLKGEEVNKLIQGLEQSIAKYKEEYAVLISQAQAIKADLSAVEAKVREANEYEMDGYRYFYILTFCL